MLFRLCLFCFISEISCPKPQNLENGFVIYTTLDYGSELEYKCDKGFHLNTEEIVFCTSDGEWSNTNIQCIGNICIYTFFNKYLNIYSLSVSERPVRKKKNIERNEIRNLF